MLRKFIEGTPALVSLIILPVILWTIIFVIECVIDQFMPLRMTGVIGALSGVAIGTYVNYVKNS